jgi:F-type H+-transporting ATPase subunit delta
MARRETAARRYAEAAFEIGRSDGTLDRWERDMDVLADVLKHAELRRAVEHPALAYGAKEKLLRRVVGEAVSAEAMNLLLLMIRRGRPRAFDRAAEHFGELLRRHRGVRRAEVRTALPLDDEQRAAVQQRLTELTDASIEMNEIVDESLIGGVAVRIGDVLYDASVRSRLERLRARLTAG